ncbi:MAG: ATP-dependent 6-phosphofructokinase [Myxococcales bacterium]|nr:ATP-dependent 6-phosphofructokinase [Myxococcales bacterium]
MSVRKIGIVTGGGDCPGLNAVIRGTVKVGLNRYGWEILGIEDACMGLIDPSYRSPHGNRLMTRDLIRDILPRGGTILGTSSRSDPFRFVAEGSSSEEDVSDRLLQNFRDLGLDALISIGGDGSMAIAQRLFEKGIPLVGVPKTIDNDLGATDQTFGFDTAVQTATEALDRIHDTARSHDRVMLVEVMGRDAGWIALHAGIAGGAHAILIPEIPYRAEVLTREIRQRRVQGQPYSVIVVAEGARPVDGEQSVAGQVLGGMPQLAGAAQRVASSLQAQVDGDVRVTVLGHLQRGGSPSSFDRILATRFGHHAAELVAAEDFGKMVALRGSEIVSVPIAEAIGIHKAVAPQSQLVRTARAVGISFGDAI